jgi:DNA-binding MarR family transcriptional regulator
MPNDVYRYIINMAARPAPSPPAGKVVDQLNESAVMALALLGHDAMRRLRGALTDHGLKPRQFQTLDLLEDRGPIGQRELGDILGIHQSVLVTFLNPLEADGYISRDRDAADRRRHVVSITPSGIALHHAAVAARRGVEDTLFAGLTKAQRAQFRELLATIRNNITNPPDDLCED